MPSIDALLNELAEEEFGLDENFDDEFDKMNVDRQPVAETLNSVTPECNICRRDVLPSLMDVLAHNQHREYPQRIFEVGDTVLIDAKEETGTKNVKNRRNHLR